jgi:phosphate transport system permease protein
VSDLSGWVPGAGPLVRYREVLVRIGLFLCALLSVLTTIGIVAVLLTESAAFFDEVSVIEFLFGTEWAPLFDPAHFGVLPLVCGTFLIVAGAALLAIPLGVGSAIYLSEYASPRARRVLKPTLEVLAGIPTVVYGYLALTLITPILTWFFPSTNVYNAASGAIVVGIMVLPMITSLCDDAIQAVPNALRDGAYALGATRFEVVVRVAVPAAMSGIIASFVLAISRAIGETMAVTLAAGATPNMTLNPLESIQTMTAYIVQVGMGDAPAGTVAYRSIFVVGALLFSITLVTNMIANLVIRRYREVYE